MHDIGHASKEVTCDKDVHMKILTSRFLALLGLKTSLKLHVKDVYYTRNYLKFYWRLLLTSINIF